MNKLFKDPVHGYISIETEWCKDFVDTKIFQRLRHIEQTSMRPLFPAARHDRFIHSLGVYHLGHKLYESLKSSTEDKELVDKLSDPRFENSFRVACLLHDCGHAPFSHTFESFYNYSEAKSTQRAYELLKEEFPKTDFTVDALFEPAPHEAFSAVVISRFYKKKLKEHKCDLELVARMITGCTYPYADTEEKQVLNCLISLLNGEAIDVDKLDYILRDTWASGISNISIDVERLISSVRLHRDKIGKVHVCYHKSAMSVIQHVVDARNYLYEWVYNHHTVLYYSALMDQMLRKLARFLAKGQADEDFFWKKVFSLEPFDESCDIAEGVSVYLPNDGDIVYLLKHFQQEAELTELDEVLEHNPKMVPVWKTQQEFKISFNGSPVFENPAVCKSVLKKIPKLVADELGIAENHIKCVSAQSKRYIIEQSHVHILINEEISPFSSLFDQYGGSVKRTFFYVYIPRKFKTDENIQKIVAVIKNQTR